MSWTHSHATPQKVCRFFCVASGAEYFDSTFARSCKSSGGEKGKAIVKQATTKSQREKNLRQNWLNQTPRRAAREVATAQRWAGGQQAAGRKRKAALTAKSTSSSVISHKNSAKRSPLDILANAKFNKNSSV